MWKTGATRLPPTVHNRISYAGALIGVLALIVFGFLVVLHTLTDATRAPYAGLVIFVLVPAVLLGGLSLIPVGMLVEYRHVRRTGRRSLPTFPVVDLNDPRQRNASAIFVVGSLLLLFLTVFGSFQAYEATESVAFCGALCHSPMQPEYTTYRNSAHARVRCVDCHVGPGADWFVKSKLSGLYQVYAVLFDKFPRPIPVPIENLRPAQETCEQCHWPEHFFYAQERRLVHYLADADNTRWEIHLLIKTGGGDPALLQSGGIHWHMNIANRVEYIASDPQRQVIPWVRVTDAHTGAVTVYQAADAPLTEEQVARATVRRMDCMDCHNRPTHTFRSPRYAVNLAMAVGRIDATLPSIEQTGVEALAADYPSTPHALRAIDERVRAFYQDNHTELSRARSDAITGAIGELQAIYRQNFFPDMRSRWDVYPDNIGHLIFPGCFRCHDDRHRSADGRVIEKRCTSCHAITAQGRAPALQFATDKQGLEFEHPAEIGDLWKEMACNECHKGAVP